MKKNKNLKWLKHHLDRAWKRIQKLKKEKKTSARKKAIKIKQLSRKHEIQKNLNNNLKNNYRKILKPPANFSIIENYGETIDFFAEINNSITNGLPVAFDMQNVNNISLEALLYILAIIDNFKAQKISYSIIGNLPSSYQSRNIMLSSGFLNYFKSNFNSVEYTEDYLHIKSGDLIDATTASRIIDFINKHLKKSKNETKLLYGLLIEMMSNTREHAYLNVNNKVTKWYLVAKYNRSTARVDFVFLDTGAGIARTIKKKMREKILEFLNKFVSFKLLKDTDLIISALKGDFRSQTNLIYRGRGLPHINMLSDKNYINNLTIIANKAHINNTKLIKKDLIHPFEGTLFSWSFV